MKTLTVTKPKRLDSFIGDAGFCSRRSAKAYIQKGHIRVNKKRTEPGRGLIVGDVVTINNKVLQEQKNKVTIIINKPRGYLSSKDEDSHKNLFSVFPEFADLNCVGRLDKESEGLLLLSNDGPITKSVTGKTITIEKEYEVSVREDVMPAMMDRMVGGIKLNDGIATAVAAHKKSRHVFRITLIDGRKHQIRRMANALKLTVTKLKRVRIHHLTIRGLRPGQYRNLSQKDIKRLKLGN